MHEGTNMARSDAAQRETAQPKLPTSSDAVAVPGILMHWPSCAHLRLSMTHTCLGSTVVTRIFSSRSAHVDAMTMHF